MNLLHFSGPALPMDDVRWMAAAQAQLDASILRDEVSLDQALLDVPHRLRELFGDVLAPGVAEAAVIATYLARRIE